MAKIVSGNLVWIETIDEFQEEQGNHCDSWFPVMAPTADCARLFVVRTRRPARLGAFLCESCGKDEHPDACNLTAEEKEFLTRMQEDLQGLQRALAKEADQRTLMPKYSDEHVQYLLGRIPISVNPYQAGQLRVALREGRHYDYYQQVLSLKDSTACALCHAVTGMLGTKRCDACWELDSRIEELHLWAQTDPGRDRLAYIQKKIQECLLRKE